MRRSCAAVLALALVLALPGVSHGGTAMAVLPFENNSVTDAEAYEPLEQGLMAMLISDLRAVAGNLRVVERSRIREVLEEIALGQSGAVDQATAVQAGSIVGARHIAFGSFMVLGTTVRMDARVVSVETSEIVLADSVMGGAGEFMALERELAERIARSLNLVPAFSGPSAGNLEAAMLFSRALAALDAGQRDRAEELFALASERDAGLASAARALLGGR